MMATMNIQVLSDDLPERVMSHVAHTCGWTTESGPANLMLTSCFGEGSITACLVPPYVGGCEVDEADWTAPGHRMLSHLRSGGMAMSVSTVSAYQYDLAITFTTALCRRHPELAPRSEEIDRAVHEMMANALVHGNLEVASPKPGMDGFDTYCKALDHALADPALQRRRVEISALCAKGLLEIAVLDHGSGYDVRNVTRMEVEAAPRQHGLAIVSATARLRIEDGGRCAILSMDVAAP